VSGKIDFVSVVSLEQEGITWLQDQAPTDCKVNLSGVVSSNTAGSAPLISWLRTAAAAGKCLQIERVPRSLGALLDLGGLDDVLPDYDRV
jgi:ABC-type transporter Mla MlaB component